MYDRKCNLNQKRNNDKCEKSYFWNPATYSCKNGEYAGSIIGGSVVIWDKIIDTTNSTSTKTVLAKFTLTNFYILLSFILITIAILIAIVFILQNND